MESVVSGTSEPISGGLKQVKPENKIFRCSTAAMHHRITNGITYNITAVLYGLLTTANRFPRCVCAAQTIEQRR